jgi:hypothetical protein
VKPINNIDKVRTSGLNFGKYKMENTFKNALATKALIKIT